MSISKTVRPAKKPPGWGRYRPIQVEGFWLLFDRQTKSYRSQVFDTRAACRAERKRVLAMEAHDAYLDASSARTIAAIDRMEAALPPLAADEVPPPRPTLLTRFTAWLRRHA